MDTSIFTDKSTPPQPADLADFLHPNDRGIAHLADSVAATLIRMYGAEIIKQD